jgi:hypothetical protein
MRSARLLATLVLGTLVLQGCRSAPQQVEYARAFPEPWQQTRVLDIQVFKRTTTVEFTNTTNQAFGPSTLWLNQRFSLPIDGLAVGETKSLRLKDFRDEFSEPFRDASFFATEIPDRLVLVQLEPQRAEPGAETELIGMIVVSGQP